MKRIDAQVVAILDGDLLRGADLLIVVTENENGDDCAYDDPHGFLDLLPSLPAEETFLMEEQLLLMNF
jgi:hypothetical protein